MLTTIISVAAAAAAYCALRYGGGCGAGWSSAGAVAAFAASQIVAGRIFRRRMTADMQAIQRILADGQKSIQQKVQRWQIRPPGSVQAAQREIESDMKGFVGEALKETEKLARYKPWVPLVSRQIATAQLQLNWMIKEFDKVDELLPKAILGDPSLVAMKLARMYMRGDGTEAIRKEYAKRTRRGGYNRNVLPAAAMSWIQLKRGDEQGAFATLVEALRNSDDATLKANHTHLMNNRPAQFSNSGLGDAWFALHLEEPKVRAQRQRRQYR